MKVLFTADKFLGVFGNYNEALWPTQLFFYAIALVAVLAVLKQWWQAERIAFSVLSFLWMWMGYVCHILYFSKINPGAYVFGVFFILQGLIFFYFGVVQQSVWLRFDRGFYGVAGLCLIIYSLFIYPAVAFKLGHFYPQTETFGVPAPTTIFTFGILLLSHYQLRWYMIMIPFLWSIIGFFTAFNLGLIEDYGIVFAGLFASVVLIFFKPRKIFAATSSYHRTISTKQLTVNTTTDAHWK